MLHAHRSHRFDPILPKASLHSLLVSMKNASVLAPDGTQTNFDHQLRPTISSIWSDISVISLSTHLALRDDLPEMILMRNNIFLYTAPQSLFLGIFINSLNKLLLSSCCVH